MVINITIYVYLSQSMCQNTDPQMCQRFNAIFAHCKRLRVVPSRRVFGGKTEVCQVQDVRHFKQGLNFIK